MNRVSNDWRMTVTAILLALACPTPPALSLGPAPAPAPAADSLQIARQFLVNTMRDPNTWRLCG